MAVTIASSLMRIEFYSPPVPVPGFFKLDSDFSRRRRYRSEAEARYSQMVGNGNGYGYGSDRIAVLIRGNWHDAV